MKYGMAFMRMDVSASRLYATFEEGETGVKNVDILLEATPKNIHTRYSEISLTKLQETDTLKKPYIRGMIVKFGLAQWESVNRVRLGTKQH